MSPALNKVQIIGNLGKEPETRSTPTGKNVTSFSVAVNRRWKDASGDAKEATDWFNVEAWARLGEVCKEHLHKGSLVYIEGRMQIDQYEKDGDTKHFTKLIAGEVQFLDRKGQADVTAPQEEIPDL
ncbi:MAG TPA: single-stranded DNA-binding protein [Anaerolineales bacterium]|nr:single-stranded DNA-binding protein [Anaerolineales bacterium]